MERKLLRIAEVADALGISRATAYDLVAKGIIPSVWVGEKCRRVAPSALDEYVRRLAEGRDSATS